VKRAYVIGALVAVALVGGAAAVFGVANLTPVPDRIPTTRPTRGDIDVRIHTMGELGPRRSMTMAAPSVGGMLQIVTLSPAGTVVKEGDVVIRFDQAEQQFNLQQAESELAEAEQAIVKLKADARVQISTDALNLLHARHELRRAEIAVSGNEFVGKIEAEKNDLTLEQARGALAQIEGDAKTHADSSRAALAVALEKRTKSQIAADFAKKNIENMTVKAPIGGLIVIKDNNDASGGFMYEGMKLPTYREGDTVQPGRTVAEVVDLSEMEITAKVSEAERASLTAGAAANITLEALPGAPLTAESKGVGGIAPNDFWEPQTTQQFMTSFGLSHPSSELRPGMTARIVVKGETLTNVTHLPRQVLFEKEGGPIVYVRDGAGFKPLPVHIVRLTENRVVLKDFPADADVALVNPDIFNERAKAASSSGPMAGASR
jgi:biotin carboxyl carrier protein